jgi:hypothetical protein
MAYIIHPKALQAFDRRAEALLEEVGAALRSEGVAGENSGLSVLETIRGRAACTSGALL